MRLTNISRICLTLIIGTELIQPSYAAAELGGALRPIPILSRLGDLHHPVSTTNAMAQRFFDQGLTLIFGFNHEAAMRSFRRALEHDPELAMAHWGIGLALGPNINAPVSPEAEKAAYEATQKAVALAGKASEQERDYIMALAKRYSIAPDADLKQLDRDYSKAMGELMRKYPDDLDAAALYAESMMNLKPWELWNDQGEPSEVTEEVVAVLEGIMARDPMHPGANHYYIHAVEASPFPERALPSAKRLETWAPAAGHLVHMPAHVYMRTGDYAAAAERNEVASEVDLNFIQVCGIAGLYPALYTSHNIHFAAVAHLLQGKYGAARRYAERLIDHVAPIAEQTKDVEPFLPTLEQVLVAFGKWEDILKLPEPKPEFKLHRGIWHFARGMAFAAKGSQGQAEAELNALRALNEELGPDAMFGPFNKARNIFGVAERQVAARLAAGKREYDRAENLLREAVAIEDKLRYMEPPDWYLYSREALGGVLLSAGKAEEAEAVFREDLAKNRRKGRALYGLRSALEAQGEKVAARMVSKGLEAAWANADAALVPGDIWWDRKIKNQALHGRDSLTVH